MTFSEKLKALRKNKGLCQQDLATLLQARYKNCGIQREDIANWETGRHAPRWPQAKVLTQYYGITLDDLFFDERTEFLTKKQRQRDLRAA